MSGGHLGGHLGVSCQGVKGDFSHAARVSGWFGLADFVVFQAVMAVCRGRFVVDMILPFLTRRTQANPEP